MENILKRPSMIIFDYGHTLVHESCLDLPAGYDAIYKYIDKNPYSLNAGNMYEISDKLLFEKLRKVQNDDDIDYNWSSVSLLFFEAYGITFTLPYKELEIIFWDAIAPGKAMPGIEKTLQILKDKNIRTAVISNISFSTAILKKRIENCIPNNSFEFYIATSEYQVRKPNKLLFQLAMQKANLSANQIWYCGDNIYADIHGANEVGIFPVWFTSELACAYHRSNFENPNCEHLHVSSWNEFSTIVTQNF